MLAFANGVRQEQALFVSLIDSTTKQLVRFDGNKSLIQNPEMQRVLLTHEIICSRCRDNKSCGNKNETPSNPVVVERTHIKFFLKCNQNCLKNAGNPREIRRFQVAISTTPPILDPISTLCISENMFVHNNSKFGRKPGPKQVKQQVTGDGWPTPSPTVKAVTPTEGWTHGGQTVIIVGENFFDQIQVCFGSTTVFSELITSHAIRVTTPPCSMSGMIDISLVFGSLQLHVGRFNYLAHTNPSIESAFERLASLVPRHVGDPEVLPKEVILKRAADLTQAIYSMPHLAAAMASGSASYSHQPRLDGVRHQSNCTAMEEQYNLGARNTELNYPQQKESILSNMIGPSFFMPPSSSPASSSASNTHHSSPLSPALTPPLQQYYSAEQYYHQEVLNRQIQINTAEEDEEEDNVVVRVIDDNDPNYDIQMLKYQNSADW